MAKYRLIECSDPRYYRYSVQKRILYWWFDIYYTNSLQKAEQVFDYPNGKVLHVR